MGIASSITTSTPISLPENQFLNILNDSSSSKPIDSEQVMKIKEELAKEEHDLKQAVKDLTDNYIETSIDCNQLKMAFSEKARQTCRERQHAVFDNIITMYERSEKIGDLTRKIQISCYEKN
jgi:hypothetical protein